MQTLGHKIKKIREFNQLLSNSMTEDKTTRSCLDILLDIKNKDVFMGLCELSRISIIELIHSLLPDDYDYFITDGVTEEANPLEKHLFNFIKEHFTNPFPKDIKCLKSLGQLLMKFHAYDLAYECYLEVNNKEPSDLFTTANLAWCCFKINDFTRSLEYSDKALKIKDIANIYDTKIAALLALGRNDEAISLYQKIRDRFKLDDNPEVYYQLGNHYYKSRDIENAILFFKLFIDSTGHYGYQKSHQRVALRIRELQPPDLTETSSLLTVYFESVTNKISLLEKVFFIILTNFNRLPPDQVEHVRIPLGIFLEAICSKYLKYLILISGNPRKCITYLESFSSFLSSMALSKILQNMPKNEYEKIRRILDLGIDLNKKSSFSKCLYALSNMQYLLLDRDLKKTKVISILKKTIKYYPYFPAAYEYLGQTYSILGKASKIRRIRYKIENGDIVDEMSLKNSLISKLFLYQAIAYIRTHKRNAALKIYYQMQMIPDNKEDLNLLDRFFKPKVTYIYNTDWETRTTGRASSSIGISR